MNEFCNKCNFDTKRNLDGRCKACANKYAVAYRASNKIKLREYALKWQLANLDKAKIATAKWRAANPNKVRESTAAYRAANTEPRRLHNQNRRARNRKAKGKLSKYIEQTLFLLQKGKCACCYKPLGNDYHLDHIMPLALGGSNTDENVQLLRATCNLQKQAKHPIDFMQQRGFLL